MSNVLLVQNNKSEGSGYLGVLLKNDGFEITLVNAKHEPLPKKDFSLVIILGAPESANDDLLYLQAEQQLIKNCVEKNIPVLGICLGSQLIAKTFGAKVYSGPKKEIGFYNDLKIHNNTSFFSGFKNPFTVFHWHEDTFDLPENAVRLASSEHYLNQAFQYKSAVGLQFHLEVNEDMVNFWLDNTEEQLQKIPYINPQKIRSDIDENILTVKSNMKNFYNNFKSSFNL
ncbi:gamma-glutamyl-gamma-aminobutyrate hydrolase family protein [Marine Group I thaumarchaeote]|jgi:GMP synthase-like glutamine amidotransferase|uniref:Gamma-glutamyl-gamma-aminobutyrate hydrolase family protein n=1 Tax=Marine Group I thaumarchaeote TaxID=2511932 RepID=A0A7K4M6J5_9ARCH|nr:MAG: GMP synthase [Nitrosopumilus sp. YT1]NMI81743.1 GMP synthase [Candidatus Nitrosopumilus sp. MTA1]NWJ19681.1 gamma-glutamyl-gamma-aminobutyrate hydrolase family protein [Marine Group I thaumarchaeote]NWJ28076.1 gamma-glutamyl-gamma-aminobutyrate hydrolase family protein [Marine Group I thaumarchaeote]NWJ56751.1 gamma-glutamyl-gamma-aminobutyrate hydrolase family protein [Marine Group I thaumarchaeote]